MLKDLQTYIHNTLSEYDKYFNSGVGLIQEDFYGITEYKLVVNLATLYNDNGVLKDLSEEEIPVDNLKQHLEDKIFRQSLLLSKLSHEVFPSKKEVYVRVKDKKVFEFKSLATNNTDGEKMYILSEQTEGPSSSLIVVPMSKIKQEFILA